MNRFVESKNIATFCLLSTVLVVMAAPSWNRAGSSKREVSETLSLQQRILANERATEERRALEAYEKRDPNIPPWTEDSMPPNPDNAALLYYQAFLLRPKTDKEMTSKLDEVYRGAEPDKQIRTYLGHCLPMIQVVEVASRIPQCTWGMWHGPGLRFNAKDLRSEVQNLKDVLTVDARTLATDGHYRAALDRCLTLRRLAQHLNASDDDGILLFSRSTDAVALATIRHVLGVMPPEADILLWLRGQLAVTPGVPMDFAETFQTDFKGYLEHIRENPASLRIFRNWLMKNSNDEQMKETVRNSTNEQLINRALDPFPSFFDSIFRIADSEMPYGQKHAKMRELYKKFNNSHGTDPVVAEVLQGSGVRFMIDQQFPFQVGHEAYINGIKAAVEVYLVLAKTGKLPNKLPEHLPKAPFTGQDFVYEITQEGFALNCQGADAQRFEFKVRK